MARKVTEKDINAAYAAHARKLPDLAFEVPELESAIAASEAFENFLMAIYDLDTTELMSMSDAEGRILVRRLLAAMAAGVYLGMELVSVSVAEGTVH